MFDKETDSLWSHILGQAMDGPLKGTQLEQIPSVMTDWASWQRNHPDTTVLWLTRTTGTFKKDFHRQFNRFVLGIVHDGTPKAWSIEMLTQNPAYQDRLGDQDVLVAYDPVSYSTRLFSRKLDDQTLNFTFEDGKLTDRQTKGTWDPVTGRSLSGPRTGRYLKPLPAILSFASAWKQFHPSSPIVVTP